MCLPIRVVGLIITCFATLDSPGQTNLAVLSARQSDPKEIGLEIKSQPGAIWGIEFSTDFVTWNHLQMVTNHAVVLSVSDTNLSTFEQKFYRLAGGAAYEIAEAYCLKADVTSPQARGSIHQFLDGLADLNLLTNLADFAFLAAGQNSPTGDPKAWRSTGHVLGDVKRLRGGVQLPNYVDEGSTNWLYFTNLPATADGRTLLVWGSQDFFGSRHAGGFGGYLCQLSSAGGGPGSYRPFAGLYQSGGGLQCVTLNGVVQHFSEPLFPCVYENSIFCASLSTCATGNVARIVTPGVSNWATTPTPMPDAPAVLRFGTTHFQDGYSGTNCWNGLIRGWAYFDRVLSPVEIDAIDALVPRIGIIINGDSKSVFNFGYGPFWVQAPQNWGLLSILTNSSMPNSVSRLNSPGNSAEERWVIDSARYRTNSQYPVILYSLRGGLHDCDDFSDDWHVMNGWNAITNLWSSVRSHGMKAVAFTLDPVRQFSTGNSNNVTWWNAQVRNSSGLYDYLVDVEQAYRTAFSDSYANNPVLYRDQVHETLQGMAFCGTGVVAVAVSPSLGYETGPLVPAAPLVRKSSR